MNKKPTILALLAAISVAAALAGCSLFATPGTSYSASSRAMAPYAMFEPADEAELAAAAAAGEANAGYVIVKVASDFDAARFARIGATVSGHFSLNSSEYYRLYKKNGSIKLVARLRRMAGVAYAQHELVSRLPAYEKSSDAAIDKGASRDAAAIAAVLDDPFTWGRYGHFETTKALDAYEAYGFGTNTVYVADIDTGINRTHEDFIDANGDQIIEYAKSAFSSADGGTTFAFVGNSANFVVVPENEDWDEEGHGTHTAGTIAALGNNGKGVAGVAWQKVKLISYKCFSDAASSGSGSDWAVYGGLADLISWKQTHSVTQTIPVNMSLGSSFAGYFELDMINQALDENIMVVASMGNSGFNAPQYPAAYTGVLAVGATKADGSKVSFSTSGNFISVSAPGYNIYSTCNGASDAYIDMSGTSMAAPFVTGTVAYLLSFNPALKPDQIKAILESTAIDIGAEGWDEDTGYGLVNVKAAAQILNGGTIPDQGATYSTKTASVYVKNTNANYDSGIPGYKSAVTGQTVYLYDADDAYVCLGITNADTGVAEFKLLKPGTYTARTNYLGTKAEKTFTVDNAVDTEVDLEFDIALLFIQTVPNLAKDPTESTEADTVIYLYDDADNALVNGYDSGTLDWIGVTGLTSGKTYKVGILQYEGATGEYGLNIGFTGITSVNTTNGRGAGADDSFEDNDTLATAKLVTVGTDYGLFAGDADYFSFVMP
jgi:thermitase